MIVTINTPIAALAKKEGLTERTLNVCRVAGITTLGDLYARSEDELSSMRNCGRKTMSEFRRLAVKYGYVLDSMGGSRNGEIPFSTGEYQDQYALQVALDDTLSQKAPCEPLLSMINSSRQAVHNVVAGRLEYVRKLNDLTVGEWVEAMTQWREILARWAAHPTLSPEERRLINNHASRVEGLWNDSLPLRAFVGLSGHHRELWLSAYRRSFEKMSVRTKNVFSAYFDFERLLPFMNGMEKVDPHRIKNCGRRSFEEFQGFIESTVAAFVEFAEKITHDTDSQYEWQMRYDQLKYDYDFLSNDDVREFAAKRMRGDKVSRFYLLDRFIVRGKTNATHVYRELYGLGGHEPKTLLDIAREIEVTRERVRQLSSSALTLPPALKIQYADLKRLLTKNVIPDRDPLWDDIAQGTPRFTTYQLMGLCSAIDNTYCIVRPTGNGRLYFVKRHLLENVRVMYTITELQRKVEIRSLNPIKLSISEFIFGDRPRKSFDKDVKELIPIFAEYFEDNRRVEFDGVDTLVVRPNLIDIPRAIEDILARHGSMMSADELQQAFNEAHPEQAIAPMGSFRAQIYRSSLVPVGRSGYYVLPSWTDTFTGKLVDYLDVILSQSDRPLSIEELTARAQQSFPQTTAKSVATLMSLDKHGRFCQFEGFLYGLSRRHYDAEVYVSRRIVKRYSFAVRFEQLKRFVDEYHRLPLLGDDEDEASLNRWMKNVEGGNIEVTPSQLIEYRNFMATKTDLPRTKLESRFLEMCDNLRRAIEAGDVFTEPTPEYRALWDWACRMWPSRGTWGDNRNKYYEQLLAFLEARGMVVAATKSRRRKK